MKEIEDLFINALELLACVLIKNITEMGIIFKSGNKYQREDISNAM